MKPLLSASGGTTLRTSRVFDTEVVSRRHTRAYLAVYSSMDLLGMPATLLLHQDLKFRSELSYLPPMTVDSQLVWRDPSLPS
jgi:hypothetical protein